MAFAYKKYKYRKNWLLPNKNIIKIQKFIMYYNIHVFLLYDHTYAFSYTMLYLTHALSLLSSCGTNWLKEEEEKGK